MALLIFCFVSSSWAEKKIIILGDSITEGYGVAKDNAFPALLEKKMNEKEKRVTIINSGVGGSTTASALGRLKWILKSGRPDLLLLILGANDGLRGLSVSESEKNLSQAIEFAQHEKIKIVLGGIYMPPNYGEKYTNDFKKMYSTLAQKYKVPLIPFILKDVAGNSKYNQADGIHPNEEGHKVITETIFKSLKDYL